MAAKVQKIQVAKKGQSESVSIPDGVSCSVDGNTITCTKGSVKLSRVLAEPSVNAKIDGNAIILSSKDASKRALKRIKSYVAHIHNIFKGLDENFVYKLEACNVHFPMTMKVDKDKLAINNFLGEKSPRFATIIPGVTVEVKGAVITVSSHDKEAAGQTAANIEIATKVRNRDRRIFQDGIFMTEKAGVKI